MWAFSSIFWTRGGGSLCKPRNKVSSPAQLSCRRISCFCSCFRPQFFHALSHFLTFFWFVFLSLICPLRTMTARVKGLGAKLRPLHAGLPPVWVSRLFPSVPCGPVWARPRHGRPPCLRFALPVCRPARCGGPPRLPSTAPPPGSLCAGLRSRGRPSPPTQGCTGNPIPDG